MALPDPLLVAVRRACREQGLLAPGPLVVAVSGGADSVCLLHLLHLLAPEFGARLHVAHFQHGLRGARADADARFVAALADRLNLPASFGSADVRQAARRRRCSLEAAAHQLRWAFLETVRRRCGAAAVATGHTLDDQAETVLLHLLRGSGLRGLAGLAPRHGQVVRPLLTLRHADTAGWCRVHGEPWREDESNAEPWCRRNAIRLEVLPLLHRFNPALEATLGATAETLQADLAYLEAQADEAWRRLVRTEAGVERLDLAGYAALPSALRRHLLRRWLGAGLEQRHVSALDGLLEQGATGAAVALPGGRQVIRQYDDAILVPTAPPSSLPAVALPVPGECSAPAWGWRIRTAIQAGGSRPEPGRWRAVLDADAVQVPLLLRPRRQGDRLALPAGTKKLQDILVDAKIPRREREHVGVVTAGNGIVWLVGLRVAAWAAATEQSARLLSIDVAPGEGGG